MTTPFRLALVLGLSLTGACSSGTDTETTATATTSSKAPAATQPATSPAQAAVAATGAGLPQPVPGMTTLHNVYRVGDKMISGDAPENAAGFAELKKLGVKTILSVDGSAPHVAEAEALGMRYVHIPVTYATVTPAQQLEIAAAVRDLPGPVFVHCHHGLHRGPAAAASAAVLLGELTPEQAVDFMKQAGTAASYAGLYACVAEARPATKAALDAVPDDFPKLAKPEGLVAAMVNVDAAFDRLGDVRAAAWGVPKDHPDLVPAAEAGQVTDSLRFGSESAEARGLGDDFHAKMMEAIALSTTLEEKVVAKASNEDLEAAYKALSASCKDCHSSYRNTSRK